MQNPWRLPGSEQASRSVKRVSHVQDGLTSSEHQERAHTMEERLRRGVAFEVFLEEWIKCSAREVEWTENFLNRRNGMRRSLDEEVCFGDRQTPHL